MAQLALGLRKFLELIRFSHTVFALPFALLACVFAVTAPGFDGGVRGRAIDAVSLAVRVLAVLLCMVFARSAAMAFNRLVDADIDRENPRTATRHIPSGQLGKHQVWIFFTVMTAGFLASCLLFLPNWLPIAGAVPVLVWICGYSYAKRFTEAAHLWLGTALALSPICAWLAIRGESVIEAPADVFPAVWLGLAIALWVAGFDIIYACQDADFDRSEGLHSIPARFGIRNALRISAGLHLGMLGVLALMPVLFPRLSLGWAFLAGLAVVTGLVVRQHAIVHPHDLRRVGEAFFQINAVISLGLCLIAAIDAVWR
jgi:4-hydroxybenzoate polyprenyltransferase